MYTEGEQCNPSANAVNKCSLNKVNHADMPNKLKDQMLDSDTSPLPAPWAPPCVDPKPHGNPNTDCHGPECRRVAALPVTQHIIHILLADTHTIRTALIHPRVNCAPECCASRRRHGQDAPVGTEILNAPYHTDNDGRQAEDSAVTGTDQGGNEGEALGVVLHEAGCEGELAERKEESEGEQEADAGNGESAGFLRRERGEGVRDAVGTLQVRAHWGHGGKDVA